MALALADAFYRDCGGLFMARKREQVERYRSGLKYHLRPRHEIPGCAEKRCSRCKTTRPRAEFRICSSRPDGLQSLCRTCQRALWEAYSPRRRELRRQRKANQK